MRNLLAHFQKMGRVILVRHGARLPIAPEPWKARIAHALGEWGDARLDGRLTDVGAAQAHELGWHLARDLRPDVVHVGWSPEASGRCAHSAAAMAAGIRDAAPRATIVALNNSMGDAAASALLRGHHGQPKPRRVRVDGDVAAVRRALAKHFPGVLPAGAPDDKVARVLKFIETTHAAAEANGVLRPGADLAPFWRDAGPSVGVSTVVPRAWATRASEALIAFVRACTARPGLYVLVCHDNTIVNFVVALGRPPPAVPFCGYVVVGGEGASGKSD